MIILLIKRPLFYIAMSFVAGMYILSLFKFETVIPILICLAIVFLIILIRKIAVKNVVILFICTLMFISGCIHYESSNSIKSKRLYKYLNKQMTICAEIVEVPVITDKTVSFVGVVEDERVRFSHYIEDDVKKEDLHIPQLGDIVCVIGTISLPDGAMNTGGFDYARYLKGENIFFQSYISLEDIEIVGHKNRKILHAWSDFRMKCIGFFDKVLNNEEGAVLKAFILGDKTSLNDEIEGSFSASGLSHILAVSGLHVGVFVSIVINILNLFKVSKRKRMLISVFSLVFFIFFTGASVSAIRAGVMYIVALTAKLIYRRADSISVLAEVAAILCFVNPHVIYNASFMLSFAATAGIITLSESIIVKFSGICAKFEGKKILHRNIKNIVELLAVSLSAQIFTIPLVICLFDGFSTMSVISTILITQLLPLTLSCGLLFCAVSFVSSTLSFYLGGCIYLLAKIMIGISDFFAGFPFARIIFGRITPFFLLIYVLIIAVFFFGIKKDRIKYMISLISLTNLIIIYLFNTVLTYDTAQISFINVGQGDCALIKTPGNCDILIDAGGYEGSDKTGDYIIEPYLIKNGVTDIEYVVLSHFHKDHTIGLISMFDSMKIYNLVVPYNSSDSEEAELILKKAKEKGIKITYFAHNDRIKVNDEILLTAITPDELQYAFSDSDNEMCLMLRLDYGNSSFIFTGDISSFAEKYAVNKYKNMLRADVLKVAHHGSKNSNCDEFLKAVSPTYAYIPVGNNSFGHPHQDAIKRLKDNNIEVYRSDIHKDVTFYFDAEKIKGVIYDKSVLEAIK